MNTREELNESVYGVLEILAQGKDLSQRELARQSGLSLGMVNLILKRLVKTGLIKVHMLDRNKINYILTPKGLSQRMVRSYQYFLRAFRTFNESQKRIDSLLDSLIAKGNRRFVVLGEGEVAGIIEMAVKARKDANLSVRRAGAETHALGPDEVLLDCRFGESKDAVGISILEEILKHPYQTGTDIAVDDMLPLRRKEQSA